MSLTVANLIQWAFDKAYRNETIADARGHPFVVRRIEVGSDMDGFHVTFFDRSHGTNVEYLRGQMAYDLVTETRLLSLSDTDAAPTIISLAWDRSTNMWIAIPSRHERGDKPDPLNLP